MEKIYGKQNKPCFNFIHHRIGKLWSFIYVPIEYFLNSLRTNLFVGSAGFQELYLQHGVTYNAKTW